jgi:Nitroreductase
MNKFILLLLLTAFGLSCSAQDIALPSPVKTGGKPLMEALNERQSSREFSEQKLSEQTLSDLLWAAYGFNRDDKRTAPSANNRQEFIIYVVMESGVYVYDAKENKLIEKVKGDFRAKTGTQDFVAVAPLNLVYVADSDKANERTVGADCGYISQNVYLYCASAGLATVVRGMFNDDEVREALQLAENEMPILTQTVGHFKE